MKKVKLIIIAILGVFTIAACNKEEEVIKPTSNESNEAITDSMSKDKVSFTWSKKTTILGYEIEIEVTITYDTDTNDLTINIQGKVNGKKFLVNGSGTCSPGATTLDDAVIVVIDENGNPLELECLNELIAECLNDFWNFYGGANSKSTNNELNVTNDELTIRDENGNIIDVNSFAAENPELLENIKSVISNTAMAWAEQTIADIENNDENE